MELQSFLWTVLVLMQVPWGLTISVGSGKIPVCAALYTAIPWIPVPGPCCVWRAASATHRKKFRVWGLWYHLFFLVIHFQTSATSEKQHLSTCGPDGGICGCHLFWWWPWQTAYCGPSCREPKAAALETVPGTVLPFHDEALIVVTFDRIHREQLRYKLATVWMKSAIAKTSYLAKAGDGSWDREGCTFRVDEQPACGAALVPPKLFRVHSAYATRETACFRMCSNAGSTLLCLSPCWLVVLLLVGTKLSHQSLHKYYSWLLHRSSSLRAWGWVSVESSRDYIGRQLFAIDTLLSAGLCIQPEEELG